MVFLMLGTRAQIRDLRIDPRGCFSRFHALKLNISCLLLPITIGYDACWGIMLVEELEIRDRVGGEVVYIGLQAAGAGRRETSPFARGRYHARWVSTSMRRAGIRYADDTLTLWLMMRY
jgi:hypothetical protein